MTRKHHHVVSEGYQRLFARRDGILLIDKRLRVARIVGTKSAFARKHFSSYLKDGAWSDEVEDEWAARENYALPHARRLIAGARDAEARSAMKVLGAIHFVRSFAFEEVMKRIVDKMAVEAPAKFALKEDAQAAFQTDFGRPPEPGEIEAMVRERWEEMNAGRALLIDEMVQSFNKTLDFLGPLETQLVWPLKRNRSHFVFADTPLVHYNQRDGRVSTLGGVALGDATRIFMPLSPVLAILFTTRHFSDGGIPEDTIQLLNLKSWDAAMRFVGCHPETRVLRSIPVSHFRVPR